MTVAIDYVIGDNPETIRQVFGLQVAVFNWMKAYFRYGSPETFTFLIDKVEAWKEVQKVAEEAGLDLKRVVAFDRRFVQENYRHITTVFRSDPVGRDLLWRRETVPGAGYNFCGLAHAIGGLETGYLLEQFCLAPTDSSDAIICPSRAVQAAIRAYFDSYDDYLQKRFNCDFKCPIQLPIIPLGIDVEKFVQLGSPDKRATQRENLGVGDDDIVLLWVGRLSHMIKAHPLAMFQAAERAAQLTGAKVHLVMLGYFLVDTDEPHFKDLAADICQTAQVHFVPNLDPRFPDGLWAAGDIFLSLIDNMQESFGLTPIEAMAAGLPRVISDWDGYRDAVEDGVDGFLVRTVQPPPGTGQDLSTLLLDGRAEYGGYMGKTALSVLVDADIAAHRIASLIRDKGLRASMAEKARARARAHYDWSKIIPQYEANWAENAARRRANRANAKLTPWIALPPQVPDPFTMYESYATAVLKPTDTLWLSVPMDEVRRLWKHNINIYGLDLMILPEDITRLINYIAAKGHVTIGEILREFATLDKPRLWRTLGWQMKLGVLGYKA
jgi:glycosyltransferase involved in cell wall biosynthesis